MSSRGRFEDSERETLMRYLEERVLKCQSDVNEIRELNLIETREVYKYKPVDKKIKLVIQELPAEFCIRREIKGDPLEEMPKLSPNPPAFQPTGRYTLE